MHKLSPSSFFPLVAFLAILLSPLHSATAATISLPLKYTFNSSGALNEVGSLLQSTSQYWWLNSGGMMPISNGVGSTLQGALPLLSPWRTIYAVTNPRDTDNGTHPQNIFRLVSRASAANARQEAYFKINRDNLSASPNRNSSNGLLLFNRYRDGDNLYYTGVRVDGSAVIKKKKNGTYYTLGYKKIFPGDSYDKTSNPNLLPKNTWIGLRSETQNNADGSVTIRLYVDKGKTGVWTLALETKDDGKSFGGSALTSSGYGGIRTDFMDVTFDNFTMTNL